jgi:hypothetical protein
VPRRFHKPETETNQSTNRGSPAKGQGRAAKTRARFGNNQHVCEPGRSLMALETENEEAIEDFGVCKQNCTLFIFEFYFPSSQVIHFHINDLNSDSLFKSMISQVH